MENLKEYWKTLWNERAESNNIFVQTGRSSYTPIEFFLMIRDIGKALNFEKEDIVLDAGGGAGWISACISPFVKEITLFDYAEEMVSKARELSVHFSNIRVEHDDICLMEKVKDKKYKKVIVSSILQYLEDYGKLETSLYNIHSVMLPKGKALFTHNPDMRKKETHITSYNRLNWSKERIKQALEMEQKRLWLDISKIKKIASKIGFSKCYKVPINPELWQSTHMFDFVVEK
jgi:predicted TPR repeat methyltransferase